MIETLTTHDAAHRLMDDEHASWSRAGAYAMVEYLEGLEDETGIPVEFDRVAIRCQYSEYRSALDAAMDYGWHLDTDPLEQQRKALDWLCDQTIVISFTGGIIIGQF